MAIAIAVIAEQAVSILYATSWQPLLSVTASNEFRQRLNGQAQAIGGVILVGAITLIGWLDTAGRTVFLVVLATISFALVGAVKQIPNPVAGLDDDNPVNNHNDDALPTPTGAMSKAATGRDTDATACTRLLDTGDTQEALKRMTPGWMMRPRACRKRTSAVRNLLMTSRS